MAEYEFLNSVATLQVLGPDIVEPAQRITARARVSGVVYSVPFYPYPLTTQGTVLWTADAINGQLAYWAGIWDTVAATWYVLAVGVSQDVDAAGNLHDVAIVTVHSSSGMSTSSLTLPVSDFLDDTGPHKLRDLVNQLEAAERGGA